MVRKEYDLIVIGGGPGGYTAALQAAKLGAKTALIEKEHLGGVCLNWGCIPTKAILHSASLLSDFRHAKRYGISAGEVEFDYPAVIKRSRQAVSRLVKGLTLLIKNSGIDLIEGAGILSGSQDGLHQVTVTPGEAGAEPIELQATKVILATGGEARALPGTPFDGERIISSREAIVSETVPQRLLIVGAGAIGLEFAEIYNTFGAQVTVVEMLPRVLPLEDEETSKALRTALIKKKIKIKTGTVLESAVCDGEEITCRLKPTDDGKVSELVVDQVLVAIGVGGITQGLGLETAGIATEHGFVKVDEFLLTSVPGIYAIGDMTGPPQLAHAAAAKGVYAVEHAFGKRSAGFDGRWVPGAVFTSPQVASVGAREFELAQKGIGVRIGRFPFSASGKAVAEGDITGFVKVLLDEADGQLLGAHIVGHNASELIGELTLAAANGLTGEAILSTIHTHPTLSESIQEACGDALGFGVHS